MNITLSYSKVLCLQRELPIITYIAKVDVQDSRKKTEENDENGGESAFINVTYGHLTKLGY